MRLTGRVSTIMAAWLMLTGLLTAEERRPNIVIILADDLGYADLGCQGCEDIPTPHIDSIAANGVRFTDGYATHPVCSPSRAGLISGMYQHRFGFEHNSGPERYAATNFGMPRDVPSLAEKLKTAGYATGMVGKWHIGFKEGLRPHERGFDESFVFLSGARSYLPNPSERNCLLRDGVEIPEDAEYLTDAFGRESAAFIERHQDTPFFLYLAFNAVHSPLQATSEYEQRFPQITDRKRRTYAGMTAAMDDAVGRVLGKLREHRLEENTLVFFYSDNGGPTWETTSRNDPLRGIKGQMFEGGIRVPFLVQWKGTLPVGAVYREMVMGFDCHATALAAAGVDTSGEKPLDGVNLIPYLTGKKAGRPHYQLFWRAGEKHAARVGDWKLVVEPREGDPMLFDLANDIGEQHDLASSNPGKFEELQAAFAEWEKGTMPARWVRQDARNAELGGKLKETPSSPRSRRGGVRLQEAFRQADKNNDGKLSAAEYPQPAVFKQVDANADGFATPDEVRSFYTSRRGRRDVTPRRPTEPDPDRSRDSNRKTVPIESERPGEPALKKLPDSDAVRDAAGRGQLFESIHVAGFTDFRQGGCNGFALADLNGDGWLDIVATFSPPRAHGARWGKGELLRVWLGEGGFKFREHTIQLLDSRLTLDSFGRGQVPNLADFNHDGFLDLFVTRHAPISAGVNRLGIESVGNSLFLTDGAWDVFRDVSDELGIRNELAYNRQSSIGDVNGDGWLDIAVGCDNIKNAYGGVPHSRLYVFRPRGRNFIDGQFEDIGGTDLVPDFGGFYHDNDRDKAGPDINLRDVDNDGDLDLLQSYHIDVREPLLDYSPGEYRQGMMCWKNLLRETGQLRFEKVTGNGLHCEARLRYNREKQLYEPASDARAPGLPYVSLADVNHDGLMDVFAIGPNSPYWAPRIEDVSGRFWRNSGDFRFEEMTEAAGLDAINNTVRQWNAFFDAPIPRRFVNWRPNGPYPSQPGLTPSHPLDRHPYYADAIFADFNNDGWLDVVVLDRSERPESRAILWMGQSDGAFECQPTTFSGLDAGGISGEAADLNNDGLLDLVFAADPDNSGVATDPRRYESRVYWNTGDHNARQNHWLRLCFTGVTDAELIGARVEVSTAGKEQYRWIHSNHTYKSGGALNVHFGLGRLDRGDVTVTLLDGQEFAFPNVKTDRFLDLNLTTSTITSAGPSK